MKDFYQFIEEEWVKDVALNYHPTYGENKPVWKLQLTKITLVEQLSGIL